MARFLKNKDAAIGKAPGELIFIGEQKVQEATIRVIDYDRNNLSEQELKDIKDDIPYKETETVTWLNIKEYKSKYKRVKSRFIAFFLILLP